VIRARIPVKPDDFGRSRRSAWSRFCRRVVGADNTSPQLNNEGVEIQHTQQLSAEVFHSNRLELLLPLLQPFLFQIRISGRRGWKCLSSSWEEEKDERSLQLFIF